MILVASGTLLALLFSCFWFVLPHWTPGLVIRWSPWVEPVVRAGITARDHADHQSDFHQRFGMWGSEAFPALRRCLAAGGPLRESAIDAFDLQVPLFFSRFHEEPPTVDVVVLNVIPIHDIDGIWYLLAQDYRRVRIPLKTRSMAELKPLVDLMSRQRRAVGAEAAGSARMILELRLDASVPYGLANDIVRACGVRNLPALAGDEPADLPPVTWVWLTAGNPPASYWMDERYLPFSRKMTSGSGQIEIGIITNADGSVDLTADTRPLGRVRGTPNSEKRLLEIRDMLRRSVLNGLSEPMGPIGLTIRATADTPWSDVVAVADACYRSEQWARRDLTFGPPLP